MHRRFISNILIVVVFASVPVDASVTRSAQPFVGVTHWQFFQQLGDTTAPVYQREVVVNILEIDTLAAGIIFRMQPGNGADPGEVTRQTTRGFVNSVGAQIGINGDFFDTNPPYPPQGGQFFTDVVFTGASNGDVYSPSAGGESVFSISAANVARVLVAGAAGSTVSNNGTAYYNAIGGNQRILTGGSITAPNDSYTTTLNPHTAIGLSQDNSRVFLLTVDGRQTDYSEGLRTDEMAQILLNFGAWNAINVDGGGSTTMVLDDSNDATQNARVINSPSDNATPQAPGTERLVANNLAVFATPNPGYVPLPVIPRPGQTGVLPTIQSLTIFDDFEGTKGHFNSAPNASGSSRNIDATSSSTVDNSVQQTGDSSLRLEVVNSNIAPAQMKLRLLSGGGTPGNNTTSGQAMGAGGYVGVFVRVLPGNDPLFLSLLIDDGTSTSTGTERSTFVPIIADGEFHLYQWNLGDPALWENFSSGNGTIDGPNSFLDGLYFSSSASTAAGGTNWAGQIWIDTVAHNPSGNLNSLVPEPGAGALLIGLLILLFKKGISGIKLVARRVEHFSGARLSIHSYKYGGKATMRTLPILCVEGLERRQFLAGAVSATLDGGLLSIVGDSAANSIVVSQFFERVPEPTMALRPIDDAPAPRGTLPALRRIVVVAGLKSDGSPTTVNGEASARFPLADVQGLDIDLGGGNDLASVALLRLAGGVSIDAGGGNDAVYLAGLAIGQDLTADMGEGNDLLSITATSVTGAASLDGSAGNDLLVVLFSTFGSRVVDEFEFIV